MILQTGTRLGPYEIIAPLGSGEMGEVYRARDTRLGRDVAVKVLPSTLSADRDRLRRLEQEACAAGALNHPNILIVHDIGTHDGSPYVVSELLEGETLRQRIGGATVAQRRVLDYALQIAHGLAAAHEKGIVHRDLKPDNVFVTRDGRVKILDFGLAKLTQTDGSRSQTEIPTRRVDTDPGMVMGTVGYMSPEQVRGCAVDHRADIFSFGAILYEMLCGRRAFHGESAADTMSAILKEDPPDLSETNHNVSPALERLVNHCLEKNPEERFHSARDLAFALEALSGSAPVSSQTLTAIAGLPARTKILRHLPWIVAGALALALLVTIPFAISSFRQTPARANVIRASINQPENASFLPRSQFAVSPDGLRIVFVVRPPGGKQLLWIRPLGALAAQQLAGTEDATYPFWSPDSRFIGYFAQSKLKKIDASGGPPQTICDAPNGRGGTWNRDGVIVFARDNYSPLYRVAASGGAATPVTKLDDSKLQATHRWPWFLPDGHHFLFRSGTTSSASQKENNGIYLGSLDSSEQRLILRVDTTPAYASGYLLFVRDNTLMAQAFDERKFTNIKGNTKNDIWILPLFGDRKPFPFLQTQANEIDAQFSPDSRWVAYVSDESGTNQVYIAPFPAAGGKWQVSRSGGTEPRWRGDGKEVFFLSLENKLMAVALNAQESTLEVGNAQPLFDVHPANPPGYHYDVRRDGKRFLLDTTKEGNAAPLALVVNWTADLKK